MLLLIPQQFDRRRFLSHASGRSGKTGRFVAVPLFPRFWKDGAMVTTELGACEWFVWDLRRSNLIDRGRLDQVVDEFLRKNARAEPADLAEFLITQGILTPFQSERLLQGK